MKKLQSYSFNGDENIDCHFYGYVDHTYSVGINISICLVNDTNKTVRPMHGYYKPNEFYPSIVSLAKKLGYRVLNWDEN